MLSIGITIKYPYDKLLWIMLPYFSLSVKLMLSLQYSNIVPDLLGKDFLMHLQRRSNQQRLASCWFGIFDQCLREWARVTKLLEINLQFLCTGLISHCESSSCDLVKQMSESWSGNRRQTIQSYFISGKREMNLPRNFRKRNFMIKLSGIYGICWYLA